VPIFCARLSEVSAACGLRLKKTAPGRPAAPRLAVAGTATVVAVRAPLPIPVGVPPTAIHERLPACKRILACASGVFVVCRVVMSGWVPRAAPTGPVQRQIRFLNTRCCRFFFSDVLVRAPGEGSRGPAIHLCGIRHVPAVGTKACVPAATRSRPVRAAHIKGGLAALRPRP